MKLEPLLYVPDAETWAAWLAENWQVERRVWLVYYKKGCPQASPTYEESVDEALCFGWIDSLIKRLDDQSHARLFTPRKDRTKWSASNRLRVRRLIEAGRMKPPGLAVLPPDLEAEPVWRAHPEQEPLPGFIQQALAANIELKELFFGLTPSIRRMYLNYILDGKREATRQKRLEYILENLATGKIVDFMKSKSER